MNDRLNELMSRYLDGDLDDADAAEVHRLIEEDAEFAAELEATRALQQAVGQLASSMEPPEALDAVMKPLRTSHRAPPRRVRPVFRWLGAAAAVVLGATVALEMARRNPEPGTETGGAARTRSIQSESEIFELAPLPTANPEEERPLGAADRLLAEEPPIPAPPEPLPLEVMGPLPNADPTLESAPAPSSVASPQTGKEGAGEPSSVSPGDLASEAPSSKAMSVDVRAAAPETAIDHGSATSSGARREQAQAAGVAMGRAKKDLDAGRTEAIPVVVVVNGSAVWWGSALSCAEATSRVRIEVRDGVVIAVAPLLEEAATEDPPSCRPEGLVGAALDGVNDGTHTAEIMTAGR